jgi:hypothetical protein
VLGKHLLTFETNKLFYNKYVYKLVIKNSLANIFREKKLSYAKGVLDDLQHQYEKGESLVRKMYSRQYSVELFEFFECLALYNEFKRKHTDYKIRIENPVIQIYSNDKLWLQKLSFKCLQPLELWEPDPSILDLLEKNVIIVNNPTNFPIKVTLGDVIPDSNFITWIEKNQDKIKIGPICKDAIEQNLYCANYYFYLRDERILELVNLMIAPSIRRIDKLVCKQNIDK